jgi:hypothetical protein
MTGREVGIRWTIGDVAPEGFEALRLAVWGAWKVFGPGAGYTIVVNSMTVDDAHERVGEVPEGVRWMAASGRMPSWLAPHVDAGLAEGKAWKFDPLQIYPDRWEIAFDNDCILWRMPPSMQRWLDDGDRGRCLIAADVVAMHGQFSRAGQADEPRNGGIRGIPPGFDLEGTLTAILAEHPVLMTSELDEQGLTVAATSRCTPPVVVSVEEVAITSPFHPHLPEPGTCGAHFVGLNDKWLPWSYYDRPATECVREHWARHRDTLYERVGIPVPAGR